MKFVPLVFGVAGVVGAMLPAPPKPWTLVIQGDADGYLSPCGCTAPMTGGIRRRAAYIRSVGGKQTVVIDAGGLGGEPGKQGELKADAAAQVAASLGVAAIHLTERDARLGPGSVQSVANLAGDRLVSSNLAQGAISGVKPYVVQGPFLIGAVSPRPQVIQQSLSVPASDAATAARSVVTAAKAKKKQAVVMFSGDETEAKALATTVAGIDILVYRSVGDPARKPLVVGKTRLVSPGEKGKHIVRLQFDGANYSSYASITLGPEVPDDATASRFYKMYLRRVDSANLLDRLPRQPGGDFVGSETCGSCHAKAATTWKASKHFHGLETLENDGHGRDPDCVSCHVVGLDWEGGFRSRALTPNLASVGCESCHGAGGGHAANPLQIKLPKVGENACATCHRPEQSPKFNFKTYWQKIAH